MRSKLKVKSFPVYFDNTKTVKSEAYVIYLDKNTLTTLNKNAFELNYAYIHKKAEDHLGIVQIYKTKDAANNIHVGYFGFSSKRNTGRGLIGLLDTDRPEGQEVHTGITMEKQGAVSAANAILLEENLKNHQYLINNDSYPISEPIKTAVSHIAGPRPIS